MAIHKQVVNLPLIFQLGTDIIKDIDKIFESKGIDFKNILIVTGSTYSKKISNTINLKNIIGYEIIIENTFEEADRISKISNNNNIDLIIGVGGGKVLDVVKRVSYLNNIDHISVPTIISNDGLISPISVLKNKYGLTESIGSTMPIGVVIDLNIIINSPIEYIQSAAGDILSNMSATNDWLYAQRTKFEKIDDISFQLSRMSAHSSIYFNYVDLYSKNFIKMIVQGQLNSGIAMELSGTSRPCSGSEHLLSHAIDFLKLSNNRLHGFQVGVLSLFSLYLQDELEDAVLTYANKIQLPFSIESICKTDKVTLLLLFSTSRKMRPGRTTIIDKFTDDELLEKYNDYLNYCQKFYFINN
jgi:glycerol-1-phosphate dehydrogenase [NAD(P)+]